MRGGLSLSSLETEELEESPLISFSNNAGVKRRDRRHIPPLKLAQSILEDIWKLLGVTNTSLNINIRTVIRNAIYTPGIVVSMLHF